MSDTPELTDVFVLTKEFATATEFSIFIERRAIAEGQSLMDTIIAYCDEKDIEIDSVGKMVSKSLKEKIRVEAVDLNMMRQEDGVLPI